MFRRSREPSLRAHIERERYILTQIADGWTLEDVLHQLLTDIEVEGGHGMKTSILELSEDGERLRHLAAPNLSDAYRREIDGTRVGEGVGSCGTVVHRGTPVYVSDIAIDPLWRDYAVLALANDLRACWSTPIKGMDGTILGTFAVYYDEPRSPRPHDLEVIASITLTVTLAIERHRAQLQLERIKKQLQALASRKT